MTKKQDKGFDFFWTPHSNGQKLAKEMFRRSRILFLTGAAGTGKSSCSLGLALTEVLKSTELKLKLARPTVAIDSVKQPFLPGDVREKLLSWFGPLYDVLEDMSSDGFERLEKSLGNRLELLNVQMVRGRTIKRGILVVDEAQNLTFSEMKSILTRIGKDGRIIMSGDLEQSDLYDNPEDSPLAYAISRLKDIDTINHVHFTASDQLREPLVTEILERW
jgi:phosphate starvation-inducible PhoH-like protein